VVSAEQAWRRLDQVDVVVMGPGPKDPIRAGLVELVRQIELRKLPFLGVCLGHQALGMAFGARLVRSTPAHGKRAIAKFPDGDFEVMRYHSLSLDGVVPPLRVVARLDDGTVMAIEHETLPMMGVQFHPDSFGTPRGRELIARFFGKKAAKEPTSSLSLRQRGEGRGEGRVRLSELKDNFALLAPGYAQSWTIFEPGPGPDVLWFGKAEEKAKPIQGTARPIELDFDLHADPPRVHLDETGFLDGVKTIREHIAAGDVYQVNLTLRAKLQIKSGAQLLAHLCRRSVPRFAAWVKLNGVELVSASPELLVETNDRWIHVEPMKGTAKDREWLEKSEKDRAELAMITDLLRDDLNRLCEPSSVIVRNERRLIELPYVVQTVADVEGTLREGTTLQDVLAVVHPGGSVTGAPREAALEDIAKLETTPRGAYCGALGLESNGTSRVALLIRTAERIGDGWRYGVGGGITWDSDPHAELEEVRLKLGALTQ
jgi:anthranilate/para-aminobenzoate synthase component II